MDDGIVSTSVCVIRAHALDAPLLECFRRTRADLGIDRVFVLFDNTHGGWTPLQTDLADATLVVDDASCFAINAMHVTDRETPEASIVMMHDWLRARRAGPVDYVWFVEHGARCCHHELATCDVIDADFMAHGCAGEDRSRLEGLIAARAPLAERIGASVRIVRVSRAFVEKLRSEFGRSTGSCEVYLPTLCATTPGLIAAAIPSGVLESVTCASASPPESSACPPGCPARSGHTVCSLRARCASQR